MQGPTEFTETLNRITVITLAITIKTRGIADADHLLYLQTMLEQILATSQHTWSEKTLHYFPSILRDALMGRVDKRGLAIQAWQQVQMIFHFSFNSNFFLLFQLVLLLYLLSDIVIPMAIKGICFLQDKCKRKMNK